MPMSGFAANRGEGCTFRRGLLIEKILGKKMTWNKYPATCRDKLQLFFLSFVNNYNASLLDFSSVVLIMLSPSTFYVIHFFAIAELRAKCC